MMPTHVIVVHNDRTFLDGVTSALESAGYIVKAFDDPEFVLGPPRVQENLELTITRAAAPHAGLRVRVTGLPAGEPYAGALGQFIQDPATVADVLRAVARFGV